MSSLGSIVASGNGVPPNDLGSFTDGDDRQLTYRAVSLCLLTTTSDLLPRFIATETLTVTTNMFFRQELLPWRQAGISL